MSDLIALCPPCHAFVHGLEKDGYVAGLDPAAVEALADSTRAAAYAKARPRSENQIFNRERARQETRNMKTELTQGVLRALKAGVDVEEEMAVVKQSIQAIHDKVNSR